MRYEKCNTPLHVKHLEQNCSCQFRQQYIKKSCFEPRKKRKFMRVAIEKTISCITFTRTCVKISMNQFFCHFYCLMVSCGFCLSKAIDVIYIFVLVIFWMYVSYYNTLNEIIAMNILNEIEYSGMNKKWLI